MNYRAPGKTHNIESLSYLFNRKGTVMVLFLWWTCWSVSMNTVEVHRVTSILSEGGLSRGSKGAWFVSCVPIAFMSQVELFRMCMED
jgi:hypothetical protein